MLIQDHIVERFVRVQITSGGLKDADRKASGNDRKRGTLEMRIQPSLKPVAGGGGIAIWRRASRASWCVSALSDSDETHSCASRPATRERSTTTLLYRAWKD